MFTLSKKNVGELADVFDFCCDSDVAKFAFARFSPETKSTGCLADTCGLTPTEYREILDLMHRREERASSLGKRTILSKKDNLWKLYLFEIGAFTPPDNPERKVCTGCHVGRANLTILADGTVYACRRFESPIGTMPQQSALEVFTSDALHAYRDTSRFKKCGSCPLLYSCRGCPAIAYYATGNFFGPDPQCWRKQTVPNNDLQLTK